MYKLRIGFTPTAFEPAGRELVKVRAFDVFENGLFFYSYHQDWLMGQFFHREEPDLRPWLHHQGPDIHTWPIVD